MIAFDLMAAVLADLDSAISGPPEPPRGSEVAPLKAAEIQDFSTGATGATQKPISWLKSDSGENSSEKKFSDEGRAWGSIVFGGSSGSGGTTEDSCGLQRGHLEKFGGSGGSFSKELRPSLVEGVEHLSYMGRPTWADNARWSAILFEADVFMAAWATRAAALGWTTVALFGVQPHPYPLSQRCGLVIEAARINGNVVAMTTDEAVLSRRDGTGARFIYRDAFPDGMVPIWGRAGA